MATLEAVVPPDLGIVLATQWGRSHVQRRTGSARLGAAVIREAWHSLDYPPETRIYQEARQFFLGPPDSGAPVSLELACLLCGIDPDHVRRVVRTRLHLRG